MRIHCLQHVPFEDAAEIASWAHARGHEFSYSRLYERVPPPPPDAFDFLVVMGGPMNVYEEDRYPWLTDEKRLIRAAIDTDKLVLGVCLGAQLVAEVLGGRVRHNRATEIGWFDVALTPEAGSSALFAGFPPQFAAFHWHGDTFDIPSGATRLARSAACENQAFELDARVVALQFHLESSAESIQELIDHCHHELLPGEFIQTPAQMLPATPQIAAANRLLFRLLDAMVARNDA